MLQEIFKWVSRRISEKCRKVVDIWQSPGRSILTKILILILGAIAIPLVVALCLPTLLISVLVITGILLFGRWGSIITEWDNLNTGDMKVPTFHSSISNDDINHIAYGVMMSGIGVVFGGIHCIGRACS